jgi:hypothetical protein
MLREARMAESRITDAKTLLKKIGAFRAHLDEQQRKGPKTLLWAATVEIRDKHCEGLIVELAPGGERWCFDATAETNDEVMRILDRFDELGAKVGWQHDGKGGVHFLLAPRDVAARVDGAQQRAPTARRSALVQGAGARPTNDGRFVAAASILPKSARRPI